MSRVAVYRVKNGRIVQVGAGTADDPVRDETVGDAYEPLGTSEADGSFRYLMLDPKIAGEVVEWLAGHELPSTEWRIGLPPSHDA